MYTSKLSVGMRAEIVDRDTSFTTYITKIIDGCTIELDAPISKSNYIKLKANTEYEIRFFKKTKMIKTCFTPIKYRKKDNVLFLIAKINEELEDLQRREYVRFYCEMPFKIVTIDPQVTAELKSNETIEGNIKDLSAGGIKFYSDTQLDLNSTIGCKITLDNELIFQLAEILLESKLENSPFKFSYSASFVGITENEKDVISRYIFNKELAKRRMSR